MRHELAKTLGRTIAKQRNSLRMTQEELAVALDIDPMTVSRFERGITLPSLLTLQQIAEVFGVAMSSLLANEVVQQGSAEESAVIVRLVQGLSADEQAFVIETLKRYRALQKKRARCRSQCGEV